MGRVGNIVCQTALGVPAVWSFGFPSVLLPPQYVMPTYYAGTIGIALLGWAIKVVLERLSPK
jgi:hypothetical protein